MTFELIPFPHAGHVELRVGGIPVARIDHSLLNDLYEQAKAHCLEPPVWLAAGPEYLPR